MKFTKVFCIFAGTVAIACKDNSSSRVTAPSAPSSASQESTTQKVQAPPKVEDKPSQAKEAETSQTESLQDPSPKKSDDPNSATPVNSLASEAPPRVPHPDPKRLFINAALTEGAPVARIHLLCQSQLPGTDLANLGIILLPGSKLIIHGSKVIPCSSDSERQDNKSALQKRALHKMKLGEKKELEALMLVELDQPPSKKLIPKKVQVRCESWVEGKTNAIHGISIAPGSLIFLDTVLVEKDKKGAESLRAGTLAITCD